ncbi:major facilitator superfamily domain-containing protein [Papiliotrema laurentii]|uniref:Major facilitator superfamily domain-containing protein n=1 Tax=Papiliotrema laurentii TaxID=5418 RepID=A0AAD9CYZ5_PAPLA|nr:major facilitator superfamily domain-containing protein [Papiliotrema laurentii]
MEKKSTDGISAHTAVAPDEVDPNNAGRHSASRFREHEDPGNLAAKEEKSPVRGARELGLEPGSERRKKLERRLKLKLDLRFSIFVVIYSMNYIDRNNAAAARLQGFEEDLHLKGTEFQTLLSILYVGYILFQVPSNMVLNKIGRPSYYIPAAMVIWGMISVLTGITTNFVGALLTRLFLGMVEAAFLPGALFILSKWYKKDELSLRYTILYCGNLISNAFGSLIAAGVLRNMKGVLGHAAWRWLFYIEGAITMFVALIAIFMLPDFPHNSRGFSAEERQLAQLRMLEDTGEVDVDSREDKWYAGFVMALTDWKIYILMLSLTACVTGLSFNIYFPTLTKTLGYGTTPTLLLAAPPWVFSCIVALLNSIHSDRTKEKFWHSTWPLVMGMIGFIISMATQHRAARYFALFLQAGSYAGYMYTWMSSSFPRPPAKRAVALAFMNAMSQTGNIAGSYIWPSKYGPSYTKSYGIVLAMFGTTILLNVWFRFILVSANKRLEQGERAFGEHGDTLEQAANLESTTVRDAKEMQRGFRFLI